MKTISSTAMRYATELTRAQNVIEATRVIQRALSGRGQPGQQTPESPRLIAAPTMSMKGWRCSKPSSKTRKLRVLAYAMPHRKDVAPRG